MELQEKINKILNEIRSYIDNKFEGLDNCELRDYKIELNDNGWLIELDYDQDGDEMDLVTIECDDIEKLFEKLKEEL